MDPQEEEKKLVKNEHDIANTSSELINTSIKNKKKFLLEESIPKEIEGIILEAENTQIQNKIDKPLRKINQQNEGDLEEFKVSKDELIESMHKTFSKKIKKNTLKLILDLREEIILLTKNISSLKKKKKDEEFNKKILKKNVVDLKKVENELKYTLNQIQTDFDLLKKQNRNLSLDHDLLKEQNRNLNTKNILLQSDLLNLQKISVELENQAIILRNNNIKINSQLVEYKNKDLVAKSKIEKLENEITTNSNLLNETNNDKEINLQLTEIKKYKEEENELRDKNQYLKKTIDELKLKINSNDKNSDNSELKDKIRHYQDENIRISSELVESNKRFDITKESLSELQGHRSHLIEKINSINEVIKNENVVTRAFDNNLDDDKIKIIDSSKPKKEDKIDLNKEIEKIFSD